MASEGGRPVRVGAGALRVVERLQILEIDSAFAACKDLSMELARSS